MEKQLIVYKGNYYDAEVFVEVSEDNTEQYIVVLKGIDRFVTSTEEIAFESIENCIDFFENTIVIPHLNFTKSRRRLNLPYRKLSPQASFDLYYRALDKYYDPSGIYYGWD